MADVPEPVSQAKEAWLDELKARWKHPLGGAYLFAWVVWNHQFLMVVLSSEPYKERLKDVVAFSEPSLLGIASHFGAPLLIAAAYIALAPWSSVVQALAMGFAENTTRRVRSVFGTKYLSPEEVSVMRQVDLAKIHALEVQLQEGNTRISELSSEGSNLRQLALEVLVSKVNSDGRYDPKAKGPHRVLSSFAKAEAATGLTDDFLGYVASNGLDDLHLKILGCLRAERKLSALLSVCDASRVTEPDFADALGLLHGGGAIMITWLSGAQPTLKISAAGQTLIRELIKHDPNAPFIQ